jgi:hypothetical protein
MNGTGHSASTTVDAGRMSKGPMMTTRSKAEPAGPEPPSQADRLPGAERAELQRQGAKAAARGETASSNPMHEPQNLPVATGERPETWQRREEAWQQGHDAETGRPDTMPAPPASQEANDGHE